MRTVKCDFCGETRSFAFQSGGGMCRSCFDRAIIFAATAAQEVERDAEVGMNGTWAIVVHDGIELVRVDITGYNIASNDDRAMMASEIIEALEKKANG